MTRLSDLIGNLNDRPSRTVEMPGREGERVGLWSLTLHEEEQARKRAYEFVQKTLKFSAIDLEYDEQRALNDSVVCEILATALRDPDSPINPYCEDAKELREKLTSTEIQNLFNEYMIFARERSILKDIQDLEKELDEMVEAIRCGYPLMARLSRYGSPSLRLLLLSLLDRFQNGTGSSASAGSSPSTPATG